MRALVLFFSMFLLLAGCSGGGKSSSGHLQFDTEEEARKVLTGDQVVCQGDCPEHVGAFYLYYNPRDNGASHDVKLCSATLIAKNKILTNKHCIEGLLKEGDLCDQKAFIKIKFPKTGKFAFESYNCKKILQASKDYFIPKHPGKHRRNVPDWAIVELDVTATSATQRQPIRLASGQVKDRSKVDLYPVYFDTSFLQAKGTIKPAQCTLAYNKENRFAMDNDSPLFEMKKCNPALVHGNSGSGVFLHKQTRLVGVMSAGDAINKSSTGTRAHCIPGFATTSDECTFSEDKQLVDVINARFYLTSPFEDMLGEFSKFHATVDSGSIQFEDQPIDAKALQAMKIQYHSPWSDYLIYLDDQGFTKLKLKFELALAGMIFPRAPRCAMATDQNQQALVLATLADWNFLDSLKWEETPKPTSDGDYSVETNVNIPENSLKSVEILFTRTVLSQGVKFEATSGLPESVKSIKIQLPACQ